MKSRAQAICRELETSLTECCARVRGVSWHAEWWDNEGLSVRQCHGAGEVEVSDLELLVGEDKYVVGSVSMAEGRSRRRRALVGEGIA